MKTERGIYLDITKSEYPHTVGEVTFYFSSMFNRNRFMNLYHEEMTRFTTSANNIYKNKFIINMDTLALIRLYVLIEKRGFYIKVRGEEVTCLDELKFRLEINVRKSLPI